jgi:hypothetical protein
MRRNTQAVWGIADQAVSSLTNFGLTVLAAHSLGRTAFGLFGVLFIIYLIMLGVSRALSSEPLTVRFTAVPMEDWRTASGEAAGTAVLVGVAGCVVCAGAAITIQGSGYGPLLAFGVAMPFLLLQDVWRNALFASKRGAAACFNDASWAIGQTVALAGVYATGDSNTAAFVLAWGIGAATGAVLGAFQVGIYPLLRRAPRWLAAHRDLNARFLVEFLTRIASMNGTVLATGAIAGLAEAAALRGAQVLITPVMITTTGLTIFGVPEAVRELQHSSSRMLRFCSVIGVALVLGSLLWGMLMKAAPTDIGRLLLGRQWSGAVDVIVPFSVAWAGAGAIIAATIGLRALAAARTSLPLRLCTGALTLGFGCCGAFLDGAYGAAAGLAIASTLSAPWWWVQLRAAARSHLAPRPHTAVDPAPRPVATRL